MAVVGDIISFTWIARLPQQNIKLKSQRFFNFEATQQAQQFLHPENGEPPSPPPGESSLGDDMQYDADVQIPIGAMPDS
jgi:hypothetical protein